MIKATTLIILSTLIVLPAYASSDVADDIYDECRLMCSFGVYGAFTPLENEDEDESRAEGRLRSKLFVAINSYIKQIIKSSLLRNLPCSKFCPDKRGSKYDS